MSSHQTGVIGASSDGNVNGRFSIPFVAWASEGCPRTRQVALVSRSGSGGQGCGMRVDLLGRGDIRSSTFGGLSSRDCHRREGRTRTRGVERRGGNLFYACDL